MSSDEAPAPAAPAPAAPAAPAAQPAPAAAAAPPVQPVAPVVPGASEADRWRREAEQARADAERIKAEAQRVASEAQASAQRAQEQLHAALVETHLTQLAARTVSPGHVVALTRSAFEVRDGKVVVKGDASTTPAQYLEKWLAGEGKHFLPPSVPAGAGASPYPAAPPAAPPMDLRTREGATQYVHSLLETPAAPAPTKGPAAGGTPN